MFTQLSFQLMVTPSMRTAVQGFLLCAGLIITIGPQNLFILRQGLQRRHLFLTALLCTLFDLVLIGLGVGGLGTMIAANEPLRIVTTIGGATFLLGYGVCALRSAWVAQAAVQHLRQETGLLSVKGTVLATVSFAFLNPAAYVDTLLMIGTTSGRYPIDERLFFGIGAVMASALWFFTLTYGASHLTPLFRRISTWRALDLISGCLMISLALSLSTPQLLRFW
jgi:L-lysine exporter family protein LysE/ArgO